MTLLPWQRARKNSTFFQLKAEVQGVSGFPWLNSWFIDDPRYGAAAIRAEALTYWPGWKTERDGPIKPSCFREPVHHRLQSSIVGDYRTLLLSFRGWPVGAALLRDHVPGKGPAKEGVVGWISLSKARPDSIDFARHLIWACICALRGWRSITTVLFPRDYVEGDIAHLDDAIDFFGGNRIDKTPPPPEGKLQVVWI